MYYIINWQGSILSIVYSPFFCCILWTYVLTWIEHEFCYILYVKICLRDTSNVQ